MESLEEFPRKSQEEFVNTRRVRIPGFFSEKKQSLAERIPKIIFPKTFECRHEPAQA